MGANKTWAWIIGVVLILIGILGFIQSPVLGVFPVNATHNVIHLITGIVFVWAAAKNSPKPVNKWLGLIYVLVAILGFIGLLGFINVGGGNDPDNWLHLVIGVVSFLIAWKAS